MTISKKQQQVLERKAILGSQTTIYHYKNSMATIQTNSKRGTINEGINLNQGRDFSDL